METELKNHGSVGYFPVGLTTQAKLVFEKIRYFDEAIERELLHSSEWDLSPEHSRKALDNSVLVSVGISVGGEIAATALQKGITNFVLIDPGQLHPDLMGRLGISFDRAWMGANKAQFMRMQILKRFPYANIKVVTEGIGHDNYAQLINSDLITQDMLDAGGQLFVAEESDGWDGKQSTRRAVHSLPKDLPWHLFMLGDVGHRVTISHETASDKPFLGFIETVDPLRDPYGGELAKQSELLALFASVGGFTGIPLVLLEMIKNQVIGRGPNSEISRVPQSREATLLAASLFAEALRLISDGSEVVSYAVADLGSIVDKNWVDKEASRQAERDLQTQMNQIFFNHESLVAL